MSAERKSVDICLKPAFGEWRIEGQRAARGEIEDGAGGYGCRGCT